MSIAIKLYTFSKRENSTAQPSGGTNFDCNLKDETSIINPEILISGSSFTSYNYAYISDFGRYYFIRDIVSVRNNLWRLSLECDVLATYKSQIGGSSEYVLRSASDFDGSIVDNLYPCAAESSLVVGDYDANPPFSTANTIKVIGIINNNTSNKFGAVQYYKVTDASIGNLMSYMLGANLGGSNMFSDLENIIQTLIVPLSRPEIVQGICNSLQDTSQYIVESFMLPYDLPDSGTPELLKAGWWTMPANAYGTPITSGATMINKGSITLDVPEHPDASDRGVYLNLSPFSRFWLYLGPFGIYPLDPMQLMEAGSRQVQITTYGDMMGNVAAHIFIGGTEVDVLHANVKCNFPVGQVTMDVARAATSVMQTGTSLAVSGATGDPMGIVSGLSGIISSATSLMPQGRSQGTSGSFVNAFDTWYSYGEFHRVADDDNTHRGRPLCKVKTISSLSGYILVSDPDISISGTAEENEKIKAYMASGFYYE